jgi:hypothetical protein
MGEPFDSKAFLASLTHRPGVYRMLAGEDTVLYVGKARDLRKRVSTYFGSKAHHPKTQALMAQTERVEVTVTGTEQEALLLEYNLIKAHHPRFNVVLRDDKSYPWIYVSTQQTFPRFEFHRGSRKAAGRFLGPWPNAGAVRESLAQLERRRGVHGEVRPPDVDGGVQRVARFENRGVVDEKVHRTDGRGGAVDGHDGNTPVYLRNCIVWNPWQPQSQRRPLRRRKSG